MADRKDGALDPFEPGQRQRPCCGTRLGVLRGADGTERSKATTPSIARTSGHAPTISNRATRMAGLTSCDRGARGSD